MLFALCASHKTRIASLIFSPLWVINPLIGLLLRVAKEFVEDDRPRFNYLEQEHYYNTRIKPILGPHVLHQELVVIRHSGIIDAVNNELRLSNDSRKEKFKGSWVGQSDWAFLIEDMRPEGELKPGSAR